MKLVFTVPGEPKAQDRPRARIIAKKGGKPFISFYDPDESKKYKQVVALYAINAAKMRGWVFQENKPMLLTVDFYMPIMRSWPKWKKEKADKQLIKPISKPDLDNLLKAIQDAMNGALYDDDSRFVCVSGKKEYSLEPRTEIQIEVMEVFDDENGN